MGKEEIKANINLLAKEITDKEMVEAEITSKNSTNIYEEKIKELPLAKAKEETVKWLEVQENIVEVENIPNSDVIVYMLESNIAGVLTSKDDQLNSANSINIDDLENSLDLDLDTELIREEHRKANEEKIKKKAGKSGEMKKALKQTMMNKKANISGKYSVLLSSPSHSEFKGRPAPTDFESQLEGLFNTYPDNFDVTRSYDTDADLNSFKNLDLYDIILINTHGVAVESHILEKYYGVMGKVVLQKTGQKISNAVEKNYKKDINTDKVILGDDGSLLISPQYIEEYNGNFNNTIIYSAICDGGYNNSMANAFLNKGAQAYLGYSSSVYGVYTDDMAKTIFKSLVQGKTIGESVNISKQEHGNDDLDYFYKKYGQEASGDKDRSSLLIYGNSSYALKEDKSILLNGNFETSNLYGWNSLHDARVIPMMGELNPTEGSYMGVISTGLGSQIESDSYISQNFYVPEGSTKLVFDYNFVSEEYPVFTKGENTIYDDTFEAYINGKVVLHESAGSSDWSPVYGMDFGSGDGTFGHTGWKHKLIDVSEYQGKKITLKFRVWDVGDSIYDSAAILDNIHLQ